MRITEELKTKFYYAKVIANHKNSPVLVLFPRWRFPFPGVWPDPAFSVRTVVWGSTPDPVLGLL